MVPSPLEITIGSGADSSSARNSFSLAWIWAMTARETASDWSFASSIRVRLASDRSNFRCSRRTSRSSAVMRAAGSGMGASDTFVSAGDQQGDEAFIVVLRPGRITYDGADLAIAIEAAERHRFAERIANQPELLFGAGP